MPKPSRYQLRQQLDSGRAPSQPERPTLPPTPRRRAIRRRASRGHG